MKKIKHFFPFILLFIILAVNAYLLSFNAFRYFNFYDMGDFLDGGWRIYIGQKPYRDFLFYPCPLHFYMLAFFFHIFGVGKTAFLAHIMVVSSIVIAGIFVMLWKRVPLIFTALVSVLTLVSFYWPSSHPWYDHSAHLWGILALTLLIIARPFKQPRDCLYAAMFCGLMAVLSFFTKSNIGTIYVLMFFVFWIVHPNRWQALGGYCLGGLLGLGIMHGIVGFDKNFFEHSVWLTSRIQATLNPADWGVNFYWIPLALVLPLALRHLKICRDLLILFIGMTINGIFAALTGNMIRDVNFLLWGPQLALAFLILYAIKNELTVRWEKIFYYFNITSLIVLSVFFIRLGFQAGLNLRMWTHRFEDVKTNYVIQTPPLQGWNSQRRQGTAHDRIANFINTRIPKSDTLFVMNDMHALYAMTQRDSYRGVPLFISDAFPPAGRHRGYTRERLLSHLPDWIVLDFDSFNHELLHFDIRKEILFHYQPVAEYGSCLIIKKVR